MRKTTWKPNIVFFVVLVLFVIIWLATLSTVNDDIKFPEFFFSSTVLIMIAGPVLLGLVTYLIEIYRLVKGQLMNWPTIILATALQFNFPFQALNFLRAWGKG